ncbi:hypothetical protein [Jiangella gansuensis]|uniref:hypothetical protein n=1 Tax=Jiangella gansuensis TaxID=281473 RepID=UPI000479A43D|nr:hypothetical protein [Jiangella gansuensis]
MIMVSSDASLAEVLASSTLIAQTWPQASDDVFLLVHLIKVTLPSLAEVLSTGLVSLTSATPSAAGMSLGLGLAELTGQAQTKDREPVTDPRRNANDVVRIDIVAVVAEGRSAGKVAK